MSTSIRPCLLNAITLPVQALQEISSWQTGSKCNVLILALPLYKLALLQKLCLRAPARFILSHSHPLLPPPMTLSWLDDLLLCVCSHHPTTPFLPPMEGLVVFWSYLICEVCPVQLSSHCLMGSTSQILRTNCCIHRTSVMTLDQLWATSATTSWPKETGAQEANGLCIFLFGCSGVSLDKGILFSAGPHLTSTFIFFSNF